MPLTNPEVLKQEIAEEIEAIGILDLPETKPEPKPAPQNETGMVPVEYKVLVKLDPVEEKTSGGIILPEDRKERDQMAATAGTLIAVGGNAFEDWNGRKPGVGERILISKYAGQTPKAGDTESLYRFCQDKDIIAVIE